MPARRLFLGLPARDLAVLCVYVAMLCFALTTYQPWEDEGRAWVLARSFGFFHLIFSLLRYEGHPAIWYIILWPLAHLHVPFHCINWLAAACGTAGIYFLLRYSPFPFYLRALLPFGFALAYEYAIVARSYVLFPLFGFMVVHEYRNQTRRPIRMAIVLALLANLSLHGTILATVFAASYAWDLWQERRQPFVSWTTRQARLAACVFAGSILFVLVVVWPTHDMRALVSPTVGKVMHRMAPAAWEGPRLTHPTLLRTAIVAAPQPPVGTLPALNLGMGIVKLRERILLAFAYPVAAFAPLALIFEALVFLLVWRRGKPLLIAGPLLLGVFVVEVYLRLWHVSLIWVSLILLLWAVWDKQEQISLPRPAFTLQNVVAAVFALICLLQLPWTIAALRFEHSHSTYPARETADYLKSLPQPSRVYGFDHSFTLEPYYDGFPFQNQTEALDIPAVLTDRPNAIVFRQTTVSEDELGQLTEAGYRNTRTFCGTPFFPNQPLVPLCLVVLEKP